jgi:putative MATE family efflux protein
MCLFLQKGGDAMFAKFVGTKDFYRRTIAIALPIMLQQGVTNFVGLLDNIMVGQLNQAAIDGVAIANQLMFIVMFALMGGLAGPGIFLAQFKGANDQEGLRNSFRIKALFALIIGSLFILVYSLYGSQFVAAYLPESPDAIQLSMDYLSVMLIGIVPLMLIQLYATSFREIGQTKIPMKVGLVSILINLGLNYVLIFGHFGFPALGVVGAAIATVIARSVEAVLLVFVAHHQKYSFAEGAYSQFVIPSKLMSRILKKGLPLFANEVLWTVGSSMLVFAYSIRGGGTVAALTISGTASNLFYVTFAGLAAGTAVMVGNELGANRLKEAEENAWKLIAFGVVIALGSGVLLALLSSFIPLIYNVDESVRLLATQFMLVIAIFLPVFMINVGCFFVLRAGGATYSTFLFDSGFMWLIAVPLALLLSTLTSISIVWVYFLVQGSDLIKTFIGVHLVRKKHWIRNLASSSHEI